jgi:hypothetical protein
MRLFGRGSSSAVAEPEAPFASPALGDAQQRLLDGLRDRGIAQAPFADLFDEGLWAELRADMDDFVERARPLAPEGMAKPERKDQFLIRRYRPDKQGRSLDKPELATDGPWLRYAASDTILDVVNSYRTMLTKLVDIDCWYTVPFPAADARVASQRWHRDPEDLHVVKAFLFFSDVDEEAGPFEYVPGSTAGGPYGELWRWGEGEEWYPPHDEFEQKVPQAARVLMTVPAGTLVLCDTSGFHRGGFARSKPRVLETHTYVSPASTWGRRFEVKRARGAKELSPQARFALD